MVRVAPRLLPSLLLLLTLCVSGQCGPDDGYPWTPHRTRLSRNPRDGLASASTLEYPLLRDDAKSEPSCEELRTIWRLTKRAARHSLLTNEIPNRPTSMFGYFLDTPDLFGPPESFGRIVLEPQQAGRRKLIAGTRYGASARVSSKGSFERVKEQLRKGIFGEAPFVLQGKKTRPTQGAPSYSRPSSAALPVYARPTAGKAKAAKGTRFGNFVDRGEYDGAATPVRAKASSRYPGKSSKNNGPIVYGVYNNLGGLTTEESGSQQGKKPFQKLRDQHRQYLRARNAADAGAPLLQADQPYEAAAPSRSGGYYEGVAGDDADQAASASDIPALTKAVLKDMLAEASQQSARKGNLRTGFNRDTNGCKDVKIKYCNSNADCSCYGLYTCVHGKCRNYSSKSTALATGLWHDKPVPIPKLDMAAGAAGDEPSQIRRYVPARRSAPQFQYDEGWDEPAPFYFSTDPAPPSQLLPSAVQVMNPFAVEEEDEEEKEEEEEEQEQPQILPHHRRKL